LPGPLVVANRTAVQVLTGVELWASRTKAHRKPNKKSRRK
jgi:hypothetical protein